MQEWAHEPLRSSDRFYSVVLMFEMYATVFQTCSNKPIIKCKFMNMNMINKLYQLIF